VARVILAAHGLSLTAAARIRTKVLLIQRHGLGKGALQLLIVVLAVDAEVGVVVNEATEDLLAVLTIGAGIQNVGVLSNRAGLLLQICTRFGVHYWMAYSQAY